MNNKISILSVCFVFIMVFSSVMAKESKPEDQVYE
ncbi:secreted protein, partial [Candidatus Magnetomorum sp. HK-1]